MMFSSYYMSLTGHVSPNKMHETDAPVAVVALEPHHADFVISVLEQTRHSWTLKVAEALRPLAGPPKPDEPTGLGAVVADAEGKRWMRICEHRDCNSWGQVDDDAGGRASGVKVDRNVRTEWAEIAAVKVLSEGVTP